MTKQDSKAFYYGWVIAFASGFILLITNGMTLKQVRGYIPPYPTMAEIGKRAAISYYTPLTRKPFVRWIVRFLRRFG